MRAGASLARRSALCEVGSYAVVSSAAELRLRLLLGRGVGVAVAPARLVDDLLFPEEIAYVARAGERRRAEFGTVRVCARRALAEIGAPELALPPRPDRSPKWPQGVVGSLSHKAGCCAAIAAWACQCAGLGLDLEVDAPLGAALEAAICTPAERGWLDRFEGADRSFFATMFFSAKEAVYKCQHPAFGLALDFADLELGLDPATGTFSLRTQLSELAAGRLRVDGSFCRFSGMLLTVAVMRGAAQWDCEDQP